MASATLVHPEETIELPAEQLTSKSRLFQGNPALLESPYQVQSTVSLASLRDFLSAVGGTAISITDANFPDLKLLSDEFGVSEITAELSEFAPSAELKEGETEDANARARIAALEAKVVESNRVIEILQNRVIQLSANAAQKGAAQAQSEPAAELSELRSEVVSLKKQIAAIPGAFFSTIISDFPDIFAEFQGKRFTLLWRGSRDGFSAKEFHRRCDGHTKTLTVILDKKGNIFGGFTPVKWDTGERVVRADPTLKSFVYTIKNPHNIPAKKFTLKPEKKDEAISCHSDFGPWFTNTICVFDNGSANSNSNTHLGKDYVNDTGLDEEVVFTGASRFQVEDIEVFEIKESFTL